MKNLIILVTFIIGCESEIFAQDKASIVVSPLIGDKLDRVEEEYFRLFPGIKDFIEAKFYSDDLISVDALITYSKNGISSDTLLKNYSSLNSVKIQINNVVFANIKNEEHTTAILKVSGDDEYEGILFSVDENHITILDREIVEKGGIRDNDVLMQNVQTSTLNNVIIEQSSLSNSWKYGTGVGAATGLVTGLIFALTREPGYYSGDDSGLAIGTMLIYISGFIIVGAAIGLLVGTITGLIIQKEDLIFDPGTPDGLSELQKLAPYQKKIHKEL